MEGRLREEFEGIDYSKDQEALIREAERILRDDDSAIDGLLEKPGAGFLLKPDVRLGKAPKGGIRNPLNVIRANLEGSSEIINNN